MELADKSAMLSVRMMEETLEALVKHGVRVSARDLQDRPLPRRRGVRPA
jgi:hypothetical protein